MIDEAFDVALPERKPGRQVHSVAVSKRLGNLKRRTDYPDEMRFGEWAQVGRR